MFSKTALSICKSLETARAGGAKSFGSAAVLSCCRDDGGKGKGVGGADSTAALIRHNFDEECECGLNAQINAELRASYAYFCMSTCLARPDVGLPGFARFFSAASAEEQAHARELVDFLQMRGGRTRLEDVAAPTGHYDEPERALLDSVALEHAVLESIEQLHATASAHGDLALMDLLESKFIPEQYKGLAQLAEMLSRVRRAGKGLGIVLLDLDLQRHPPAAHGAA